MKCRWWPSPCQRPVALAMSCEMSLELLHHRCRQAGFTALSGELLDLWYKTNLCLLSKQDASCRNGYFGLFGLFFVLMAAKRAELVCTKLLQMFPSKV